MTVTPEQAEHLQPDEKKQANELETMIDGFLLRAPKDTEGRRLYSLPDNVAAKVLCNVVGTYEAAGWMVEHKNRIGFMHENMLYFKPMERGW